MTKQGAKNFSIELDDCQSVDEQVESVGHPLVKQVLNQVLAEESGNAGEGSSFGEGGDFAG